MLETVGVDVINPGICRKRVLSERNGILRLYNHKHYIALPVKSRWKQIPNSVGIVGKTEMKFLIGGKKK